MDWQRGDTTKAAIGRRPATAEHDGLAKGVRSIPFPETVGLRTLTGVSIATNRIHWALFRRYSHRKGPSCKSAAQSARCRRA